MPAEAARIPQKHGAICGQKWKDTSAVKLRGLT
jgi:hypothetical protein